MKLGASIWKIAMLLWPVLASSAHADGQQSSADYQFTVESIDSGGLLASSGDYTGDGSFRAGSFSTSADYAQRGGYIGQLNNLPVVLAGVNLTSTNGVNLTTNAPYIFHTNGPNLNNQIVYAIRDGQGGSASVAVAVVGMNTTGQSKNITMDRNAATLSFGGIPGYTYGVQRSTNLMKWITIWTTNAPANGLFQYTDNFSDLGGGVPSSAYYRLSWSPKPD
jgi:hypothetical protein